MKKRRLFIVLAVLVFCGVIALTSYGIGWCADPIRLGFAGPLSGELSSYGKGLAEISKAVLYSDVRSEQVFHQGVPPGGIDYSSIIQKLKHTQAEVVIYGGYHPLASKIIRQLRIKKMKTIFISGDGIKDEAFIVSAGKFAEGVYATAPKDTSNLPKAIIATNAYKKEEWSCISNKEIFSGV